MTTLAWASVLECTLSASAIIERVAIPEELTLEGWDVLTVGRTQAWPFVTFAAPTDERSKRTLWIDTDFAVADGSGREVEGTALARLEPLVLLIVSDVTLGDDELVITFEVLTRGGDDVSV